MIEIEVTQEMREEAIRKSKEMGRIRNSILQGEGNMTGFLGEEIVKKYLSTNSSNTYNYDLIINELKLEVKSKKTTVKPKDYYECSIASYNPNQKCDYYVFVRVLDDYSKGWILGYEEKGEYFRKAKFLRKGQKDGDNGFTVKADCYNLEISQLRDIKLLIDGNKEEN